MADSSETAIARALGLHQAGRLDEAAAIYRAVLAAYPGHFDALHLSGVIALQQGDAGEAVRLIGDAVARAPQSADALCNLGSAWRAAGDPGKALASYARAIELAPDHADARRNRSRLLLATGDNSAALADLDVLVRLRPDAAEAHAQRGNALRLLQRPLEALAAYDAALALQPDYADAHANRGSALLDMNRHAAALASFDAALAHGVDHPETHKARGHALAGLRRYEDAAASYERALAPDPTSPYVAGTLLFTRMRICDWRGIEEAIVEIEARIAAGERATLPFQTLIFSTSPELQLAAARVYAQAQFPATEPRPAPRQPGGKLRIGYYSADFHDHATAWLIAEAIEAHDRAGFEIFAFSFGPDEKDAMRRRIVSAVDNFIDARAMPDAEIARLSRELGIDIAVDLKGHTQHSRPGIFAARCAPVQVNWLGYPGTMGAEHYDYIVADRTVLPEALAAHFSEAPVWLPGSYQPNDSRRRIAQRTYTRREAGLPGEGFVFACFNNNYKILPGQFDSWMRILDAVKGSVLWLLQDNPAAAANLRREARARGVDPARLVFAPRLPLAEHLARHRLAGLFLDTLPCNAHTTASDALWAGLPVLTVAGEAFAGRVCASLLTALGMEELIASSPEAYEALAVELAHDPVRLAGLGERLRQAVRTSPLFDGKRFARHLEQAYRAMIERSRAGLRPEPIAL